ncbi:carboxypeptidase regulatory-like domain-containing protein [Roseimaritima sediminicola]|uniref:carboxypeptidase regulatory-like domain-containing protein n=1 Tax=Roseimaritima sediminicola TaxID=2662066 RepID=UPI00138756FF|nr:carboxypeptidase regulatory-like domain-containing protein [Roseimaritima sediminicola]
MMNFWNALLPTAVGAALLLSVGCGGGDKNPGVDLEPVKGKVLLDGSPVQGAIVVFHGERGASGVTDANGEFILTTFDPGDGAKEGIYKVTVAKSELVGVDSSYSDINSPNYGKTPPPEAMGTRKYIVAQKYSQPETSNLTADVQSGSNEFTFEVTSK